MAGLIEKRLESPPYLQIALDTIDLHLAGRIVSKLPASHRILVEVGTPLIKSEGAGVANELKKYSKARFVVADMKTMDTGKLEANIAFKGGADAATVAGSASTETVDAFVSECKELGIYSIIDCMDIEDPVKLLSTLKMLPDIVNLHRGIDEETHKQHLWSNVMAIKKKFPDMMVSVAGGLDRKGAEEALRWGADIVVVGRFITDSEDITKATQEIVDLMNRK